MNNALEICERVLLGMTNILHLQARIFPDDSSETFNILQLHRPRGARSSHGSVTTGVSQDREPERSK